MHCRLLTQYAIIMVQFLTGLQKMKLHPGYLKLSIREFNFWFCFDELKFYLALQLTLHLVFCNYPCAFFLLYG